MAHNLKIGDKTFSGIETIQTTSDAGQILNFLIPDSSDSELQWASGFKDCTAGQSFKVEGLSFTPKGYAFMLMSDITENTDITNSTNSLFYCFYDTETKTMRRSIGTNKNYTLRVNPSATSGSVFEGGFEQKASTQSPIYNVMGQRYFWIAWG